MPRVSVLIPLYNGEAFLKESLDSILNQSFRDIEVILLNDGSKDRSAEIAQSYKDARIRYIEHPNMGLPATLNKGLAVASGEIIVRQDQDDISLPERIARQVECLDSNPKLGLIGCWATIIDEAGRPDGRLHRHPAGYGALLVEALFDSPFVHSSVAMRRDVLQSLGGYCTDRSRQPPEDFELWSRILRSFPAQNIPEPLVRYREVRGSISRVMKTTIKNNVAKISAENLRFWALRGGSTLNETTAIFTASRMTFPNEPHDCSIDCDEILAAFNSACDGIISASGSFDERTQLRKNHMRLALKRAWSVGSRKTRWGWMLDRARWKLFNLTN